jgi:rieske iron-sulfur protein
MSKASMPSVRRRTVLSGLCALSLPRMASAQAASLRENDWLVFAYGERAGKRIVPEDLILGEPQVVVYPMDPASGAVRDDNRLNQTLLVRLDPAMLSEATSARAVGGIVAYSGVCSHTGCDVTEWHAEEFRFQCPCHESEFDPADAARVVGGPAPWQLAALPLKLVDEHIAVAGPFEGRLGFMQPGLDPFGGLSL